MTKHKIERETMLGFDQNGDALWAVASVENDEMLSVDKPAGDSGKVPPPRMTGLGVVAGIGGKFPD